MRLSVQCFTLRDEFAKDVWKTFGAIREMGLRFVELAGTYGLTPDELRKGLDALGLQVSGAHLGFDALEEGLEQTIEDAYTLDNRYLILPWVGEADYRHGWDVLGGRLDRIGERVREAGLRFAYHNHAFEFVDAGGKPGLDVLFDRSSPDHVLAELDTAWVRAGGQYPASYIRHYGERAPLIHLKDVSADGRDLEAGTGILDWDDILSACREADAEFGVIEMDNPPQPALEAVSRCVRFFRDRGFST